MSIRAHTLALAFASVMAGTPLVACAADNMQTMQSQNMQTPKMQQPLPYMVMMVTSSGMVTERQVNSATATELMKHATPLKGMMVLVHDGKAYAVENMRMSNGKMPYDELSLPANLIN